MLSEDLTARSRALRWLEAFVKASALHCKMGVSPGSCAPCVAPTLWASASPSVKWGEDSLIEWLGEASEFMYVTFFESSKVGSHLLQTCPLLFLYLWARLVPNLVEAHPLTGPLSSDHRKPFITYILQFVHTSCGLGGLRSLSGQVAPSFIHSHGQTLYRLWGHKNQLDRQVLSP